MTQAAGALTISLDFELYWGSRDHRTLDSCRENILGGRAAIPKMLELFEQFGIHATWATVGMMFFESRTELAANLPALRPSYANQNLDPYCELSSLGKDERDDPFHFAPSLIALIRKIPHQEIGTHSFSHYYCLERGQNAEQFRADLDAARSAARKKFDVDVHSLVFPRNQFNANYLAICGEAGIKAFRGNQSSWIYEPKNQEEESLWRRAFRLADSYLNLSGHHGHRPRKSDSGGPIDVPASRFLRPYSRRLRLLEPLRLRRICNDLTYCARHGLVYHLWWHPDNFGTNQGENLAFLTNILGHFKQLKTSYGMESKTMSEAASLAHD